MKTLLLILTIIALSGCITTKGREAMATADIAKATSVENAYKHMYGAVGNAAVACGQDAACMRSVEELAKQGGADLKQTAAEMYREAPKGPGLGAVSLAVIDGFFGSGGFIMGAYQSYQHGKTARTGFEEFGNQPPSYVHNDSSTHSSSVTRDSGNSDSRTYYESHETQTVGGSIVDGDQFNLNNSNNNYPPGETCIAIPFTTIGAGGQTSTSFTLRCTG